MYNCVVWWGEKGNRARPGFEPGTSRTLSENHTPRPTSHWRLFFFCQMCLLCHLSSSHSLVPGRVSSSRLAPSPGRLHSSRPHRSALSAPRQPTVGTFPSSLGPSSSPTGCRVEFMGCCWGRQRRGQSPPAPLVRSPGLRGANWVSPAPGTNHSSFLSHD